MSKPEKARKSFTVLHLRSPYIITYVPVCNNNKQGPLFSNIFVLRNVPTSRNQSDKGGYVFPILSQIFYTIASILCIQSNCFKKCHHK